MKNDREQARKFSELIQKYQRFVYDYKYAKDNSRPNSTSYYYDTYDYDYATIETHISSRPYKTEITCLQDANDDYYICVELEANKQSKKSNYIDVMELNDLDNYLSVAYQHTIAEQPMWIRDHTIMSHRNYLNITKVYVNVPAFCHFEVFSNPNNDKQYIFHTPLSFAKLDYSLAKHKNHFLLFVWPRFQNNQFSTAQLEIKQWCFIFNEKAEVVSLVDRIDKMEMWINESILQKL